MGATPGCNSKFIGAFLGYNKTKRKLKMLHMTALKTLDTMDMTEDTDEEKERDNAKRDSDANPTDSVKVIGGGEGMGSDGDTGNPGVTVEAHAGAGAGAGAGSPSGLLGGGGGDSGPAERKGARTSGSLPPLGGSSTSPHPLAAGLDDDGDANDNDGGGSDSKRQMPLKPHHSLQSFGSGVGSGSQVTPSGVQLKGRGFQHSGSSNDMNSFGSRKDLLRDDGPRSTTVDL